VTRTFVLAALLLCGCSKLLGGADKGAPLPAYADGAAGLQALFGDLLEAARHDERGRVHDLLASTFMSDAELETLFGPARARELQPHYHSLMETLCNRGAIELVAQIYERKYDAVEVLSVDPTRADARPTDRVVAAALKVPLTLYSVRVKRAGEDKGLRYDFFFYLNGRWRTGNLLGKELLAEAPR
jgi:hypothetical protein